jgi:hypothetical protein
MNILCSAESDSGGVGMYKIQLVEENVYKATLRKFTGSKHSFPGLLLLRRDTDSWLSFPEGYTGIVHCLVNELEKLFPGGGLN